jgi:hypothetical protein
MKIRQHIPSYISGLTPKITIFNSIHELLEIEWIKQYKDENLSHFCRDDEGVTLMIENEDGTNFWVLGYILDGNINELDIAKVMEM